MPHLFRRSRGLSRASTPLQSRRRKRRGWPGCPGHDEEISWPNFPTSRCPPPSAPDTSTTSMASACTCWKPASRLRPALRTAAAWLPRTRLFLAQGVAGPRSSGYHVIAPDQRGYGRTSGWDPSYEGGSRAFRLPNLVRDALGLVSAFGHRTVDAVIGHDFGSSVAAWCALIRPDVFRSVVMMSAPFGGPPSLPFNTADGPAVPLADDPIHRELAALPRPRKHYQWYYSTRQANADMQRAPQGVHDFLRAYYHHKSADWKDNQPYPLESWSAAEIAKLPTYYVMDLARDMAATVAEEMPSSRRNRQQQMAARRASLPSTAPNMRAPVSRAACNGIAAARRARSRRNYRPGEVAPSTCRPLSSPASRTGAPISARASLRRCRPRLAPT